MLCKYCSKRPFLHPERIIVVRQSVEHSRLLLGELSARLIAQRAGVVDELLARSAHFGDHVQAEEFDVVDDVPFGLIDVGSLLASRLLDFVEH